MLHTNKTLYQNKYQAHRHSSTMITLKEIPENFVFHLGRSPKTAIWGLVFKRPSTTHKLNEHNNQTINPKL